MKKILFILSSAALVFTACQKEESTVAEAGDFELTATIEQQVDGTETKTSLSSGNILWTAGDAIMVFDANGKKDKLVAQTGGRTSTSFKEPTESSEKARESGFTNDGTHYAIYPYTDGVSCSGSTITFTLPSTQTYAAGTFGQDANVAVATIGTTTSFYNVCGVLKLQLTGSATVTSIELSGTSNEVIYGKYTVDATSSDPTTTYVSDGGTTITLDCSEEVDGGVTLTSAAKTFYFVVPVGAFANGLSTSISTGNNLYLFGRNHSSGAPSYFCSIIKVYSCALFNNNTLVRSFIPAICKSGASYTDGNTGESSGILEADKPGMFDLVTGKFFVNLGSDDFTAGPAVTE